MIAIHLEADRVDHPREQASAPGGKTLLVAKIGDSYSLRDAGFRW